MKNNIEPISLSPTQLNTVIELIKQGMPVTATRYLRTYGISLDVAKKTVDYHK